jgi:hypothetical protein
MAKVTPSEIATFLNAIADGIDGSKSPKASLVASDIKAAIAALDGHEGAIKRVKTVVAAVKAPVAAAPAAEKPIRLDFQGPLTPDLISRAAAEVAKRRPGFEGKKLKMSITAEEV